MVCWMWCVQGPEVLRAFRDAPLTFSTLHSMGSSSSLQQTSSNIVSHRLETAALPATATRCCYSLEVGLLLGEHPHAEVAVLVRLEGGRDDKVLARRQREAAAHLAQVDEGLGACGRRVAQEEVAVQVDVSLAVVLTDRRAQSGRKCCSTINKMCTARSLQQEVTRLGVHTSSGT